MSGLAYSAFAGPVGDAEPRGLHALPPAWPAAYRLRVTRVGFAPALWLSEVPVPSRLHPARTPRLYHSDI
eukprot:11170819-Alexandrium_andersonii.AAC.1